MLFNNLTEFLRYCVQTFFPDSLFKTLSFTNERILNPILIESFMILCTPGTGKTLCYWIYRVTFYG